MKIVSLTPGTGSFYCGSCLRDHTLVKALREQGHDATMVPMYLPLVTDEAVDASDTHPIQYGGINVYLQQKSKLFRGAPRLFDALFNQQWMLKKVASRSNMTSAAELADLTISMLKGEAGRQHKELDKLIDYLKVQGKPDIVSLSNGLLIGVLRQIKSELGCKVLVSLQGEDAFLDTLPDAAREHAWQLFSERAAEADALIAPSDYYSRYMQSRLAHTGEKYHTLYNGIRLDGYALAPHAHADAPMNAQPPAQPTDTTLPLTIGFLARMCYGKGLHTLVDAFILLRAEGRYPHVHLHLAGAKTAMDESYIREQQQKIEEAHLSASVTWEPNMTFARKQQFIPTLSVLSVPANIGEAFGMYLLEAWACGIPVVQPRDGAFPELLQYTGGGILVEPDDTHALAKGLQRYLDDAALRASHGRAARQAVEKNLTHRHMAENFLRICAAADAGYTTRLIH